ncbi:TetR/AcrR family transcriptional regulator [Streptantibioticus cattleyicolor]|uniref:TetR family transcriptional regulator n=1 Tax=Streptantibioticus cattleyicolor (strain ATCC 35852 / DSM 46488 / JCM 4925 / NBRC 14057 / NRRL 8057) TaxID=1003195 RepID=F8JKB8_STREN|nr:TetR/AcrR family transcriptional regulator [Streptantibioticus cattleyicolor]AEW98517.1 TetR family transcriptional regulator [Streptantibioticus cattleyicolor NRRL 8057 = DSM 46488]CCB72424.1 Transcriptional regulator, TetR family [Streptantibioticus cattleyicolor NRRL 8057 = DSM 46488]
MSRASEPRRRGEQRRGAELRRHILFVAKDVFLETGYERASMDTVASRAETSKRSLYAHFESKEKLFLAVLDLIRELYLGKLRTPDAYAEDPAEAVTLFCGRFLELMTWEAQVRTCRLAIAEAERLPGSSTAYFDAVFATTHERLTTYLADHSPLAGPDATALAEDLLARTVLPKLFRTLLGVDPALTATPGDAAAVENVDLTEIRRTVTTALPR